MRYLICVVMLMIVTFGMAQDKTVADLQATAEKNLADDTSHKHGWRKGANINLGIAQGNSSNWAAGAEQSSLAINANVNLFATYKTEKTRWINSLDLLYSFQRTNSQGNRKTGDRIDYYTKWTRTLSKKWGFGVVGNFRTQFTRGYNYDKTPYQLTSDFFAPAYVTVAPGFDWTPKEYFNLFMSPISGRWTIVTIESLREQYAVDPGRSTRFEAGAFISAIFKRDIMKNVNFRSRLDLYSNYLSNPQNVDIFWTNLFTLKVNKWLGATYSFDLIYDDDVRLFGPNGNAPRTQVKSLLSVGLTTKL
jgi:Protein of unknown function (DUF3078)